MGKEFKAIFGLLGVVMSASALISLVQAIFSVGLIPSFAGVLEFYRNLATPILDLIHWPIRALLHLLGTSWAIPEWVRDLHILSFVGAGIFARSLEFDPTAFPKAAAEPAPIRSAKIFFAAAVMGFTFVGLIYLIVAIPRNALFGGDAEQPTPSQSEVDLAVAKLVAMLPPELSARKSAAATARALLERDAARIANRRRIAQRTRLTTWATLGALLAFYAANFSLSQIAQ